MDYCKCKESFVDAEVHYVRHTENVKFIEISEDYAESKSTIEHMNDASDKGRPFHKWPYL